MRLTPARIAIRDEYDFALDQAHRNGWEDKLACHTDPATFSDYRTTPSQAVAQAACAGCPLFRGDELCVKYAKAFPPAWGILGGVAWVDGHPFVPASEQAVAA